jgi:hypothetical protein
MHAVIKPRQSFEIEVKVDTRRRSNNLNYDLWKDTL